MGSLKHMRKRDFVAFCVGGYVGVKAIKFALSKVLPR